MVVGDLGTYAGLKTDAYSRVLDGVGQPIPGLYAVGNDIASIMGGNYPGAGITLGPALTFGHVAGCHLAGVPTGATQTGSKNNAPKGAARPLGRGRWRRSHGRDRLRRHHELNPSGQLLHDHLVLVTGAGQGNGRAIAIGMANAGAKVVVTDIRADTAESTADVIRENDGEACVRAIDVGSAEHAPGWPRVSAAKSVQSTHW